ncbi:glycosyltransferase family 39 protein [Catenulispora pinisilvae]|uniref:glycosyltransferase family 39 protein n=1 Tax=Catenulispora pinisilvae TaxID=2705253 RepID=UPI001E4F77F6|nr:glycosyltransferase family 39 protein [Catenulispora pinisilvae]
MDLVTSSPAPKTLPAAEPPRPRAQRRRQRQRPQTEYLKVALRQVALRQAAPSVLAVYGVLKLIGFLVFMWLLDTTGDYRSKAPRYGGGAHAWDVLSTWDGWWYRQIAEHGYHPQLVPVPGGSGHWSVEQNSAAFFPLYPGLIRAVSATTGLGSYGAGMTVSVVASFAAALGIYAVASGLAGHRVGLLAAALWAVWPGSGVEWSVYSDSLYIALAVWTCHFVLAGRWLTAGAVCLVAGLSRPTAFTLIAALAAAAVPAALRDEDGRIAFRDADGRRRLPSLRWRPLAALALAPLGLAGYLGWVGEQTGDLKAYSILESDAWDHYFDFGRSTAHVVVAVLAGRGDYESAAASEDLVGVGVLLLTGVLLVVLAQLRPPTVLAVYTVCTVVLAVGTHEIFGMMSRYLLPTFPLLLPAAMALDRLKPPGRVAVLVLTALASGSLTGYMLFEIGIP